MKKGKRVLSVILIIVLMLAAVIAVNHNLAWVLLRNFFPAKIRMDTTAWEGGKSYEKLAYASASPSQYLDLYVPDSDTPLPLFVLIHGGGFISGDSQTRQAQFLYRYFRNHGFACASVNYRLAGEAPFPAAIEDVRSAVHFLADNAAQYNLDAEKIAVWGESAGGYLAATEAVTETEVPISALVDFYGVADFPINVEQLRAEGIPRFVLNIAGSWSNGKLEGFHSYEEYWVRKAYEDWTEEEFTGASAVYKARHCVNPKLRSMILHGDADITVAYDQSILLRDALAESCGADRVDMQLLHGLMHAADGFYTDAQLAEVEAFLRAALQTES